MEFFIVELLLLCGVGSVLLMFVGVTEDAAETRVPNLNRFATNESSVDRPTVPSNATQDLREFDAAA